MSSSTSEPYFLQILGDSSVDPEYALERPPEERLVLAVLERAVRDFIGGSAADASDAREWLYAAAASGEPEPYSFPWICEQLGLLPREVLTRLELALKQSKEGSLPFFLDKRFADSSKSRPSKSPERITKDSRELPTPAGAQDRGAPAGLAHPGRCAECCAPAFKRNIGPQKCSLVACRG